jgi:hypothetical protein
MPPSSLSTQESAISACSNGCEDEYWLNVADFDFNDDSFTTAFSSSCTIPQNIRSTSRPSTPFHNGTSGSIAVHPLTPSSSHKKKYYAITKGRWIGVYDNW